jgi:outer membrane scaffolding protein for murein synthesis (MipA/OmpV family)
LLGVLASRATPSLAQEQDLSEQRLEQSGLLGPSSVSYWNVTLGAGAGVAPTYLGAKTYRAEPIPIAAVGFADWLSLGPSGLSMNVMNFNGFRAGPVIGYLGGRNQDNDPRLNGLGNIDVNATVGGFADYSFGPFDVFVTARQAIAPAAVGPLLARDGLFGLMSFNYRMAIIPKILDLEIGPEIAFADSQYNQNWFGISPTQSAASGLPVFTPGAGITDVGFHASLTYHYSEHILVRAFADIKELTDDDAKSPIVESKAQGQGGIGIAYHF